MLGVILKYLLYLHSDLYWHVRFNSTISPNIYTPIYTDLWGLILQYLLYLHSDPLHGLDHTPENLQTWDTKIRIKIGS